MSSTIEPKETNFGETLFSDLFTYDPADIDPERRLQMVGILRARAEYLHAAADVSEYRIRSWSGEAGLGDIAELKAASLARLRQNYADRVRSFIKESVDIEGLTDLIPAVISGVLQNFKVPLPVLMEALGIDLDQFKMLAEQIRELNNDM